MSLFEKYYKAYNDGEITKYQFFIHVILQLNNDSESIIKKIIIDEDQKEFENFVKDILNGASLFLGGEMVIPSKENMDCLKVWFRKNG